MSSSCGVEGALCAPVCGNGHHLVLCTFPTSSILPAGHRYEVQTLGRANTKVSPRYTWGDECDGWRLLDLAHLSVIEERMPPGTSEVRHMHQNAHQMFYVLEGVLSMDVEGVYHQLAAADAFHIPPGAQHLVRNDSGAPVRFLVISSPSSTGDRLVVSDPG